MRVDAQQMPKELTILTSLSNAGLESGPYSLSHIQTREQSASMGTTGQIASHSNVAMSMRYVHCSEVAVANQCFI